MRDICYSKRERSRVIYIYEICQNVSSWYSKYFHNTRTQGPAVPRLENFIQWIKPYLARIKIARCMVITNQKHINFIHWTKIKTSTLKQPSPLFQIYWWISSSTITYSHTKKRPFLEMLKTILHASDYIPRLGVVTTRCLSNSNSNSNVQNPRA